MLECRDALFHWGFHFSKGDVHRSVRLRFDSPTSIDLQQIGRVLDWLSQLRSKADYDLASSRFMTDSDSSLAITTSERALSLLDSLDSDPIKRAGALFDIRTRFP